MNKLIGMVVLLLAYGSIWAGAQEDDLIRLAKSGVDSTVLTSYINVAKGPYHLSVNQIIELKKLGVASSVVSDALQHHGRAETPRAVTQNDSTSTPPPVAPDSQISVAPAPVIYPYPYPYYDYGPYVDLGWWWGPDYYGWGGRGHDRGRGDHFHDRGHGREVWSTYHSQNQPGHAAAAVSRSAGSASRSASQAGGGGRSAGGSRGGGGGGAHSGGGGHR